MKRVARFLLKIVTGIVPVFIAACYGPGYEYSASGKVVDALTRDGIGGIKISCTDDTSTSWSTGTDGSFWVYAYSRCPGVVFEDVDGPENGGRYVSRTLERPPDGSNTTVELTREP